MTRGNQGRRGVGRRAICGIFIPVTPCNTNNNKKEPSIIWLLFRPLHIDTGSFVAVARSSLSWHTIASCTVNKESWNTHLKGEIPYIHLTKVLSIIPCLDAISRGIEPCFHGESKSTLPSARWIDQGKSVILVVSLLWQHFLSATSLPYQVSFCWARAYFA